MAAPRTTALSEHLDHLRMRDLATTHIRTRQRSVHRMATFLGRDALTATTEEIKDYLRRMPRTTARSRYAEISHLSCFYQWAYTYSFLGKDPMLTIPRPRLPRLLPRPMCEADVQVAIESAPARTRLWLVLAAYQGLRACEIAALERSDVLDTIPAPALIAHGKGRKDRVVPLCERASAELRVYGLPVRGPVFPRLDGRAGPTTANRVSAVTNGYLHGLGITDTLHTLRHRAATGWYAASQDILVVGALLGHSDPSTTASYAAFSNVRALAAVQALDEAHPGAS